jgi:hypothetical protein
MAIRICSVVGNMGQVLDARKCLFLLLSRLPVVANARRHLQMRIFFKDPLSVA